MAVVIRLGRDPLSNCCDLFDKAWGVWYTEARSTHYVILAPNPQKPLQRRFWSCFPTTLPGKTFNITFMYGNRSRPAWRTTLLGDLSILTRCADAWWTTKLNAVEGQLENSLDGACFQRPDTTSTSSVSTSASRPKLWGRKRYGSTRSTW